MVNQATQLGLSAATQLLVGAGGGAVAALGLLKFFGERWLTRASALRDARDRRLHETEIENLRHRINRQFDRLTKLSQREFEVLPTIWFAITEAYASVENVTSRLQSRIDLSQLPESEAQTFVAKLDLPASVFADIFSVTGSERNRRYWLVLSQFEAIDARNKASEAHFALVRSGVFLPKPLFDKLDEFKEFLWSTALDHHLQIEAKREHAPGIGGDQVKRFIAEGRAHYLQVEEAVRERLRSGEDTPA